MVYVFDVCECIVLKECSNHIKIELKKNAKIMIPKLRCKL